MRGALDESVIMDDTDTDGSVDVSILWGDAVKVVSVLSVERFTVEVGTRSSLVVVALRSNASKLPGSGTCWMLEVVVIALRSKASKLPGSGTWCGGTEVVVAATAVEARRTTS